MLTPIGQIVGRIPQQGDVLGGKYKIGECLGKGGMGLVFRATHLLSEKQVAVKWMLRPMSEAHASGRFMREARAAGRIDHPNVVDVYDVGEEGRFGYLVMELLHGESLGERLDRGKLDVTEAIDLLLPAMHGVAAAHKADVIHRDLKPDNIFLCRAPDGGAREAKVLDFGISSFTNANSNDTALTKDGSVLGTPAYMSPEQLKSSRNLDVRTDVYSLGVILYESITGAVPFSDESFTGLVLAIANSEPAPPSSLLPELSADLELVIMRSISRNRDDRYPDVDSFIAALTPFASRRGSVRPPPSSGMHRRARASLELNNLEFEIPASTAPGPALIVAGTGQAVPTKPPSSSRFSLRARVAIVAFSVTVVLLAILRVTLDSNAATARDSGPSTHLSTTAAAAVARHVPQPDMPAAANRPNEVSPVAPTIQEPANAAASETGAKTDSTNSAAKPMPEIAPRVAPNTKREVRLKRQAPSTAQASGRSGTISLDDL